MKKYGIFLVFAAAFLIRLFFLNQSLWLDEATTAKVVSSYDYLKIISKFSPSDFHPPLYYLFMKSWSGVFGTSEIALRMPSVLFSLGAGYFIFLMAGIWGAAFFLFNPLIVYFSQEARMYMMAVFLLTAALYYLKKISMKNIPAIILFNVCVILAFYSFYGSAFLIAPMFLYLLYKKQYRVFVISAVMSGAYAALIMPLVLIQMKNAKIALAQVSNWSMVLGKANIKNLALIPIKFAIGRIDFLPKSVYYLVAGAWTAIVFAGLKNALKKENLMWILFFFVPIFLGVVFSFASPLLQYFRFIYLIPIMSILLAKSIHNRWYKLVLITGFSVFSLVYIFIPQFHREDWKGMALELKDKQNIYMVGSSSDPLKYYLKGIKITDLREIKNIVNEKSLTLIPYTADIHGIDYKKDLAKKGFRIGKAFSFRGLTYEEWIR